MASLQAAVASGGLYTLSGEADFDVASVVVAVFEPPFTEVPLDLLVPSWRGVFGFVLFAYFTGNLIANTFIDLEFRILPDKLTKPLMAVAYSISISDFVAEMHT